MSLYVAVLQELAVLCRLKVRKRVQSELDKFESDKCGVQKCEQVLIVCVCVFTGVLENDK